MKLAEIATRITVHLRRFESDPAIADGVTSGGRRIAKFYKPHAWASGRYVGVRYITYQTESHMTKQEAMDYLAWLDAGNVGKHFEMKKQTAE